MTGFHDNRNYEWPIKAFASLSSQILHSKTPSLRSSSIFLVSTHSAMQFTNVFATLAAIATLALAAPQCDTAEVQCCNHITKAGDPEAQQLLNQVGAVVDDLTVSVGIDCNPITVIGAGFGSWYVVLTFRCMRHCLICFTATTSPSAGMPPSV